MDVTKDWGGVRLESLLGWVAVTCLLALIVMGILFDNRRTINKGMPPRAIPNERHDQNEAEGALSSEQQAVVAGKHGLFAFVALLVTIGTPIALADSGTNIRALFGVLQQASIFAFFYSAMIAYQKLRLFRSQRKLILFWPLALPFIGVFFLVQSGPTEPVIMTALFISLSILAIIQVPLNFIVYYLHQRKH